MTKAASAGHEMAAAVIARIAGMYAVWCTLCPSSRLVLFEGRVCNYDDLADIVHNEVLDKCVTGAKTNPRYKLVLHSGNFCFNITGRLCNSKTDPEPTSVAVTYGHNGEVLKRFRLSEEYRHAAMWYAQRFYYGA